MVKINDIIPCIVITVKPFLKLLELKNNIDLVGQFHTYIKRSSTRLGLPECDPFQQNNIKIQQRAPSNFSRYVDFDNAA